MNSDPYGAALHVAQQLQILEDDRGTMRGMLDDVIRVCQQLIRNAELSPDDKVIAATIIQEAGQDIELLYSMGVFDRMNDWRDVVADLSVDPFDTIAKE